MSLFDVNKATVVGNLTRDPELTYTPKGTALLKFGVATNRSMKMEDGSYKDLPTYHNIIAWAKLAERISKIAKKGKKAYIEGRIENRSYEKKDGTPGFTSEIVADNIIVFERSVSGSGSGSYSSGNDVPPPEEPADKKKSEGKDKGDEDINPDDIPF
jgi:single-strand DNA-binding protein